MTDETGMLLEQLMSTATSLFHEIEKEIKDYFNSEGAIDRLVAKLIAICIWIVAIIIEMFWQSPLAKVLSMRMTDWATSLWGINGNTA
jgi:hypothetical protein